MAASSQHPGPTQGGSPFKKFHENNDNMHMEGYNVLMQLANNLLAQPGNPKFSRIKIKDSLIHAMNSSTMGLLDCLLELGYKEEKKNSSKYLVFDTSQSNPTKKIQQFKNKLQELREKRMKGEPFTDGAEVAQAVCDTTIPLPMNLLQNQTPNPTLFSRLKTSFEHVAIYETPDLQKKARDCIPVKRLTMQASKKFLEAKKKGSRYLLPDFILLELLTWFKHDFFQWVDAPACEWCGGKTRGVGGVTPLPVELAWWGNRVENYQCELCGSHTRFPRYNHPGKLLETRRGRCGEWANCFALCSRAMGLETRYILDFTDHVWIEYYSVSQKRWVHADPCENTCDTPLVYEVGWGKKLTYIFAFSYDDIQDVIWRYSVSREETLARRTECGEGWLAAAIGNLRKQRQASLTPEKRAVLTKRALTEMVEFFTPKVAGEEETMGRQSGSLAWRSQRGEVGESNGMCNSMIKLTDREKQNKIFHLQYCCASDKYQRLSDGGSEVTGWGSLIYQADSIHRKEEPDWKMAYLARKENSDTASVVWKINFSSNSTSLSVDRISLYVNHACFENGSVKWMAFFGFECCELIPGKLINFKNANESDAKGITILAFLSGGTGSNAWQHTQLFRQGLNEKHIFPFSIKIHFR